jgi:membrane-associated phospholipid phosphatase
MNNTGFLSAGDARPWNEVYQWGLAVVRAIQTIKNPVLTALINGITALGSEVFYIPAILLAYWCIHEKKGLRLALLLLVSVWANTAVKVLLKQPRPFFLDPSVGIGSASGYGLPSGHAQHALVFWAAALSGFMRKRPAWLITTGIALVVGFTRLYLGLHFPTDLLGGWFLALLILGGYYFLLPPVERLLAPGGKRMWMIGAAVAAFGMNALYPEDRRFAALFLGFAAGYFLMRTYFPFSASARTPGSNSRIRSGLMLRGLRFFLGSAGLVLLYYVLTVLLGEDSGLLGRFLPGSGYSEPARFLSYGIPGLWVSAGAPWIFLRLGLAAPFTADDAAAQAE